MPFAGGSAGSGLILSGTPEGSYDAGLPINALPSSSSSWLVPQANPVASASSRILHSPDILPSPSAASNQHFDTYRDVEVRHYFLPSIVCSSIIVSQAIFYLPTQKGWFYCAYWVMMWLVVLPPLIGCREKETSKMLSIVQAFLSVLSFAVHFHNCKVMNFQL